MSKETEEWRDIKGYEGLYQISDWGRVKALKRNAVGKGRNQYDDEHILKLHKSIFYGKKRVQTALHNLIYQGVVMVASVGKTNGLM